MQDSFRRARASILDVPLTALFSVNLEGLFWLAIIVFTIATRFWDLGSRSYNHDESLHTLYSWYLYQGRGYSYDPMMHGPFQFDVNALLYFLFGDTDYTGRLLPAIFGVIAVTLPIFLRKYLGRAGALLMALSIAIAPDILYYSRFARDDIYHAVWCLLAIIGLFGFISTHRGRYLILGAVAMSLMWSTMEVVFIFGFTGFTFLAIVFAVELLRRGNHGLIDAVRSIDKTSALIAASAAAAVFVVLYTTFFTNPNGIVTGLIGGIQYWLSQQEVARGGQPWYYYLILLPLYNFMPMLAASLGIGYYAIRRNTASASFGVAAALMVVMAFAVWGRPPDTENSPVNSVGPLFVLALAFGSFALAIFQFTKGNRATAAVLAVGGVGFVLATLTWKDVVILPPIVNSLLFIAILAWAVISLTLAALQGRGDYPLFTAFLIHWLLTSFIIYSWAGEKMPWLSLHMSLPAIVLGAKFVNDRWRQINWASVRQRGGLWLGLLVPLIGYVLLRVLLVAPFQGISIQKLDATLQWGTSVVVGALLLYAAWRLARRLTRAEVAQVAFAALLVVLAAATLRYAFMGAYEHGDIAVEMLIYAQGTPDVPLVMKDIQTLSGKLTGGTDMDIVVESSETWPFAWYLRDYKKVAYPASLDSPPTAPVVIAGYENIDKYKPWMTNYVSVKRKLIWWFAEDYKGMTWERAFELLSNPVDRQSLLDFLLYRKFEVPLGQWPLRKEFTFYVRKDVANLIWTPSQLPPAEVDTTNKEFQDKQLNTAARLTFGTRGTDAGQVTAPKGVAVAADGSVFVTDSGNHRIEKFDAAGKFVLSFGSQGTGDGMLQEPWGVAVAPNGTIYVADTWNHRIQRFDPTGKFLGAWGLFGDAGGQAAPDKGALLYGPRAVAVDQQGNVFVSDTGNKRIVKYDPSGQVLGAFGGAGTASGQLAEPVGIALSAATGDIYVADTWNHRVQRFSKDFAPISDWTVTGWDTTSVVNKPYIALDASDNVYLTDPENHRVLKYTNDGKLLAVLGKPGTDLSSFNLPTGIAVDAQGGVIVADSGNNRIMRFDALSK